MFNLSDTIVAICTPPGVGGIAAIRVSGSSSWEIISNFFSKEKHLPQNSKTSRLLDLVHMQAVHGYIKDSDKIIDEVIVLPYKSPKSYTAEDVIEIFCHGGNQISSIILDLCLKNGARHAKRGEFTFRAFVNGRIDLTKAEAINEIIHADTQKAAHAASNILVGSLKQRISNFRERLFNLITSIESSLEFPMDVPDIKRDDFSLLLNNINFELNELIESSKEGQILRNGVKVSIIGAPNVGKSSLLNQLLGDERAIVTKSAGTTRDTIEEKIIIDGWPIVLVDTAGIREARSIDEPEKIGIEKTLVTLKKSDIALLVFDISCGYDLVTEKIFNLLDEKPRIVVGNKIDLVQEPPLDYEAEQSKHYDIAVSAKYGKNIDELKKILIKVIKSTKDLAGNSFEGKHLVYINQRHKELLLQCRLHTELAMNMFNENKPEDLISDELKKAISKLDEISGRRVSDDIIKNIFSKFCIGK